jgi:hypothetical protein
LLASQTEDKIAPKAEKAARVARRVAVVDYEPGVDRIVLVRQGSTDGANATLLGQFHLVPLDGYAVLVGVPRVAPAITS